MKAKHLALAALGLALAFTAMASNAYAQGMILDPDGAPTLAGVFGWFESLFAGWIINPDG